MLGSWKKIVVCVYENQLFPNNSNYYVTKVSKPKIINNQNVLQFNYDVIYVPDIIIF